MCGDSNGNYIRGIVYLCFGLLYLPLYLLCMWAMCQQPLRNKSCYQIMIAIGLMDVMMLIENSFICGYWTIVGLSYCEYYWIMKIAGAFASGEWASYCALCLVLGLNRVQQMTSVFDDEEPSLFTHRRTMYWICGCYFLGFFWAMIYLSPYITLLFNSSVGLFMNFSNTKLSIIMPFTQVTSFSASMIVLYSVFLYRTCKLASFTQSTTAAERQIYIQVLLVTWLATSLALSYIIVPLITQSPDVYYPLNIYALFVVGSNSFVYLTFNKTVREKVKSLFIKPSVV